MHRWVVLCVIASGCTEDPPAPDPDPVPPSVVYLSPAEHLVRASMTLRQKRPSPEELAQVSADPDALGAIVDGYLEGPELGTVMKDLHAETLLVRVDLGNAFQSKDGVANRTAGEMVTVTEEPLRLIEYVIANDRPYSEIVTADYAIADPITSVVWGMMHSGGPGLEVSHWNDARPVAGILSSSGLWARHISAGSNYHRNRANLISSALLCFDFLHSDILLDTSIDLANPQVVANALVENASCAGCHQTLDPLASTLRGFQFGARYANYPVQSWGQRWIDEWIARGDTHRPAAFFGQPALTVVDVGQRIAADPRFPRCTAERFAAYFTQVDREDVSFPWLVRLTDQFLASGMNAKQLAKDIVMSDEFRVSHVVDGATAEEAEALHGMLRTRPEQLGALFEDLTGFQWRTQSTIPINGVPYGVADLLRGDFLGFRALAGGIDSYFVTRPTHTTNAVSSLLLRELARSAAGHVVEHDFAPSSQRTLLAIDAAERDPAAIRAELARLHARIFGTVDASESDAVAETYALFAAVLAETNDTRHAWRTTLTAMLSDLRVAFY
ncbi:MAG: hypothetical protein ACKV2T_38830 [Kofleriaceae bacterium]